MMAMAMTMNLGFRRPRSGLASLGGKFLGSGLGG